MTAKALVCYLFLSAGVLSQGHVCAQTNAVDSQTIVAIVTTGKGDKTLSERVGAWVAQNVAPVEIRGNLKPTGPYSLGKVYTRAIESRGSVPVVTLVLAGGISPHGETHGLVSNGVAVVDVDMLKPSDTSKDGWQETFCRRVEKESLAGVAYALGMMPCVFERCALKPAETLDELDAKGRNLCPPCQVKLQALLEEKTSRGK